MEHIRKALEQAEKDRAEARSGSEQAPHPAFNAERETTPANPPVEQTVSVSYDRTKNLAVAPEVFERNRLVAALPDHELTDTYRMLRTRVLQQMKGNHWNALAMTSPATGSGKTTTAINLAISLARDVTTTVLLVDLDLRSPSVHKYFDYEPEAGIGDYLHGDAAIEDMLFSPGIDRLVVLPGRLPIMNSAETLRSPKMVQLVDELKNRYTDRIVICDLPPILATDDALTFAPYTDAILMVAEAGATRKEDLQEAISVMKHVPIIGTVLNKSESAPKGDYGRV
jgi:capsular exopolysaccharide synthesis family protein